MNKPPSSPTLNPSTRQGQNVLALGEPVGLAGTLLGLIEHPIAIGRLRALIIELATSGRLRQRKIGASHRSAIGPAPEQLPEGWVRLPLSELAVDFQNGIAKRSGDRGTPIPVLRLADITRLKLKETELREIILTPEEQTKYQVDRGDFLVIRVNGSGELVGRFIPCTVQRRWAYSDHLIRVRPRVDLVDQRYLCLFANSETARRHLVDKTVTTAGQKTINQGGLGSLPVVVPPIEEQKRIVAKVDQLMALCDDLEAKQTKKRDLATQSTHSALTALATAESSQEFTTAWTRVLETWSMLLDHSGKVEELRRSMLELALWGGLATQAAGDTTAGTLLQGIDAYWSEESRSKQRPSETDPEFEGVQLPSGWARCRIGRIIRISSGDALPSHAMTKGGKIPVYGGNGVTGYHDAANLSRASIVMGRVGFYCGSVHLTPDQAWVTDNAFVISYPDDFLDQKFLYWLLLRIGRVVRQDGAATAQPVISGKKLYPLFVMLPPREEQSRIAERLEHLMNLCGDLEAKLVKQEETATCLAESLAAAVAAS